MTALPSTSLRADPSSKPFRIVYSLLLRLAPLASDPPGSITELVVQLDRRGNAIVASIQAHDRGKRIIDLRSGDELLSGGKWRTITAVSSFSDSWLTQGWAAGKAKQPNGDGYLYRPVK